MASMSPSKGRLSLLVDNLAFLVLSLVHGGIAHSNELLVLGVFNIHLVAPLFRYLVIIFELFKDAVVTTCNLHPGSYHSLIILFGHSSIAWRGHDLGARHIHVMCLSCCWHHCLLDKIVLDRFADLVRNGVPTLRGDSLCLSTFVHVLSCLRRGEVRGNDVASSRSPEVDIGSSFHQVVKVIRFHELISVRHSVWEDIHPSLRLIKIIYLAELLISCAT